MDPRIIQGKVEAFAHRLLVEADGDPIRALGLLVLVLDTADFQSADHAIRLMVEVRNVLMPEPLNEFCKPVRHLAGAVSWEGLQHCLVCGKTLAKNCHDGGTPLEPGYVFEIGPRFTSEACDNYSVCA
jgi:hypothetical protein